MTTVFSAFSSLMAAPSGGSEGTTGSMVTTFITFGLIILVFYFLIIRPQKQKEKQTKDMINAIKKGDKVVTIGGIRGTVTSVKNDSIVVKVDDNTKIEFTKGAVSSVITKKDAKTAQKTVAVPSKTTASKTTASKTTASKTTAKKTTAKKTTAKKPSSTKQADPAKQSETKSNNEENTTDSAKTE